MPAVLIGKGYQSKSKFYYSGDGYYYHFNRTLDNGSLYLRCIRFRRERCTGRAVASKNFLSLNITSAHTCCANYDFWKVRKLRESILSRCSSRDTTCSKTVVAQESERYERRIRMQCSAKILRSAIRRARLKMFPRIPKDLSQLDQILRSEEFRHLTLTKEGDGYIYAGSCGSSRTHTRSLIFQSPKMHECMATAKVVFADATWDGRPACPKSSQIFSITTLVNREIIPLCVCLMERKCGNSYRILLESIKKLNPDFDPLEIHTDFEIAEYSSFLEVFKNAEIHGCLYHYANNVSSQARTLGLGPHIAVSETVDSLVRSCLAIPLVPTEDLKDALGAVMLRARDENLFTLLKPYFQYIYNEYIIKRGHVLSVCGSENRTNNVSESWNNTLQEEMKVRKPNVFHFLSGLRNLEEAAHQNHFALLEGYKNKRARKISAIVNDSRILNLNSLRDAGQISMDHFLRSASRTLQNPYRRHCPQAPNP